MTALPRPLLSRLWANDSLVLFLGISASSVLNLFFNVYAGRALGPDPYSVLAALLTCLSFAGVLLSALQVAITQAVASEEAATRPWGPGRLDQQVLRLAIVMTALTLLLLPALAALLHIGVGLDLVLLAAWVGLALATVFPQGVLLGQLRFKAVGLVLILGSAARLIVGVVLIEAGAGVAGAIEASVIAAAVSLVGFTVLMRQDVDSHLHPPLTLKVRQVLTAVVGLLGYAAFSGVDVVLARHYLEPRVAGYYGAGSVVGRLAVYVPAAVAGVAFPQLSKNKARPAELRRISINALSLTGGLGALVALVITVGNKGIISLLLGPRYVQGASVVVILAWGSVMIALVGVLILYHQSIDSARGAWASWLGTATLVLSIMVWHEGSKTIAELLAANALLLVLLLWPTLPSGPAVLDLQTRETADAVTTAVVTNQASHEAITWGPSGP